MVLLLQASSIFSLLVQRMHDVAGAVRLEAIAAAAAAAKKLTEDGDRRCLELLMGILSASLRDPEDTVRLAGLEVMHPVL